MNRHKKWGIIALVICIIGGIVMFSLNHQKERTLEEKMRIEQDRIIITKEFAWWNSNLSLRIV